MVQQHQRGRNTRPVRPSRAQALRLSGAIALILGSVAARYFTASPHNSRPVNGIPTLTPVRYEAKPKTQTEQPPVPVLVSVDGQESPAAASATLADTLRGFAILPDNLPNAAPDGGSTSLPAWFGWARLDGKRAHVQVNAPATVGAEELGVYATRGEWGTSLCLVNKTNTRLLTTAQLCLPRGVYTIERLTLGQGRQGDREIGRQGEEETQSAIGNRQSAIGNRQSAIPSSSILHPSSFAHLEGCDFGGTGTVRKVFCLEPGQACLYRCVDTAREARAAWRDVFTQLQGMATHQSGPAHRLSVMLREADSYLSGVRGGGAHGGRDARLECIHHLLLVTAQAHSLHHNYQMRHTIDETSGKEVMAAMDRLTVALSETSAVLLGLVPQVAVTSGPVSGAQARTAGFIREQTEIPNTNKKEKDASAANIPARPIRAVVVSLENTGGRSVTHVKLGLNMAGMPGGVTCEPADPAYFDALRPGQSVRAVFHVRGAAGADFPAALLIGDVSYFAGTAPAHLRPRAW